MNRAEILARVARALNKNSTSLDALTKARLLDAVNTRHRQILSMPGGAGLRRRTLFFNSTANMFRYGLPNVEAIHHITDLDNQRELTRRSFSEYRQWNPFPPGSTGTPDAYVLIGFQPALQPLGALPVVVASSDAADVGRTLTIEGAISGKDPYTQVIPFSGTTGILTTTLWTRFDRMTLSVAVAFNATVTVTSMADLYGNTTEYARILPNEVMPRRYLTFYLDATPSALIHYQLDVEAAISDLSTDTDEPMLPSDFHDLLVTGTCVDELAHLDDDRLVVLQQQYHQRLGELKLKLARMDTPTGPRGMTSRYGSWGPATSW